jgi:Mg/Co/Ni transporter MgtE
VNVEFAIDTTPIDDEIELLKAMRNNVMRGLLEAGRDDENRLVFRITAAGRESVERMVR